MITSTLVPVCDSLFYTTFLKNCVEVRPPHVVKPWFWGKSILQGTPPVKYLAPKKSFFVSLEFFEDPKTVRMLSCENGHTQFSGDITGYKRVVSVCLITSTRLPVCDYVNAITYMRLPVC